MVQLTIELVADLDHEAQRRGCSRSAVVLEAVAEKLARTSVEAQIRRYVDSYERQPQGGDDAWGDLGAAADRAGVETARMLDDDECEAGEGLAFVTSC